MTKRQARIYLAAAIVLHRGHVLLVRRSKYEGFKPGIWGIPCGKLDEGERSEHAVVRELREETGLNGTVIERVGRSQSFWSEFDGHEVENIQDNFLVSIDSEEQNIQHRFPINSKTVGKGKFPDVVLPEKDQKYTWVSTEEIENFGLDNHNLAAIQQGLQSVRRASP